MKVHECISVLLVHISLYDSVGFLLEFVDALSHGVSHSAMRFVSRAKRG